MREQPVHGSRNAQKTADARLAEHFTAIAIEASAAILAVDFRNAGTRRKADQSPVTAADEAAQAVILQASRAALPGHSGRFGGSG